MKEDKQKILDLLLPALQATRNLHDLEALEYDADQELVYAKFANGNQKNRECGHGFRHLNDQGRDKMRHIKRAPSQADKASGAQIIQHYKHIRF